MSAVARHDLKRGIHVLDHAVGIRDHDRVRDRVQGRGQTRLLLLRLFLAGDILGHTDDGGGFTVFVLHHRRGKQDLDARPVFSLIKSFLIMDHILLDKEFGTPLF